MRKCNQPGLQTRTQRLALIAPWDLTTHNSTDCNLVKCHNAALSQYKCLSMHSVHRCTISWLASTAVGCWAVLHCTTANGYQHSHYLSRNASAEYPTGSTCQQICIHAPTSGRMLSGAAGTRQQEGLSTSQLLEQVLLVSWRPTRMALLQGCHAPGRPLSRAFHIKAWYCWDQVSSMGLLQPAHRALWSHSAYSGWRLHPHTNTTAK